MKVSTNTFPIIPVPKNINMPGTVETRSNTSNSVSRASLTRKTSRRPKIINRLSEWFWPVLPHEVDHFEGYSSVVNVTGAPVNNDNLSQMSDSSASTRNTSHYLQNHTHSGSQDQSHSHLYSHTNNQEQSNYPCRTCRIKGKRCDLQQPFCSQCWEQQILCFYVPPLSRRLKKGKGREKERDRTKMC